MSAAVLASDVGEGTPLLRPMVNFSAMAEPAESPSSAVGMSERPGSYKIAAQMGRAMACWNYAYPEYCLKVCVRDSIISREAAYQFPGLGARCQNFSAASCAYVASGAGLAAICCFVQGYCGCCYNSTQFCVCMTDGCCVCGNAGCMSVAGYMGIAAGSSLAAACGCCCTILFCMHAVPDGAQACDKLGCHHCAEGLLLGYEQKKKDIQRLNESGPPAQIRMGENEPGSL